MVSGGSRISKGEALTGKVERQPIILANLPQKLHENEKNWARRGRGATDGRGRISGAPLALDPPMVVVFDFLPQNFEFITDCVRSTIGRLCFDMCLPVHGGGGDPSQVQPGGGYSLGQGGTHLPRWGGGTPARSSWGGGYPNQV